MSTGHTFINYIEHMNPYFVTQEASSFLTGGAYGGAQLCDVFR
ncbi:hypothetical protein Psfp_01789 [Pelotomaculum sp. FP]|nr:hypothetical protein Psfp_01789 [Pelotomaculum sp. FP]